MALFDNEAGGLHENISAKPKPMAHMTQTAITTIDARLKAGVENMRRYRHRMASLIDKDTGV